MSGDNNAILWGVGLILFPIMIVAAPPLAGAVLLYIFIVHYK